MCASGTVKIAITSDMTGYKGLKMFLEKCTNSNYSETATYAELTTAKNSQLTKVKRTSFWHRTYR